MKKCHEGGGIRCLIKVLEALVDGHCCCDEGSITLTQGVHEVTIKTDGSPSAVFVSIIPTGTPVCSGNIDMVGYTLLVDGFVLYANIQSNTAEIKYFVEC